MNALIIGPSWVGDMVMAQSLFLSLKKQNPELQIDVLAPAWTEPLLARMPQVNKAFAMPLGHGEFGLGKRFALGKALRQENYQQAIVLPNSFKSALLPLFAKVPMRTGWKGEARSWILNDCRILNKLQYPLMVQRFVALAYKNKTPVSELEIMNPALLVDSTAVDLVKTKFSLNLQRKIIVLCPGAEFGASKKWPEQYYAEVAQAKIEEGFQVWIMGSQNDQLGADAIVNSLPVKDQQYCTNFAGKTLLGEAIDLISLANAVVSNDSGLMHIAAALDKPLVVIYGSTSADFTPPLAEQVKSVSLMLDCSPCFKRECPLGHMNCMNDLKPNIILEALNELAQNELKR